MLSEDWAAFRAHATTQREASQVQELLLRQPGTRLLLASPGVSSALRELKSSAAKEESRHAVQEPEEDEWSLTPGRQQVGCKFAFFVTLLESVSHVLLDEEEGGAQLPAAQRQGQVAAYAFLVSTLGRMAGWIDRGGLRRANVLANSAATALLRADWTTTYDAFYDAKAVLSCGTPELALAEETGDLTCPEDVAVLRALTSHDGAQLLPWLKVGFLSVCQARFGSAASYVAAHALALQASWALGMV